MAIAVIGLLFSSSLVTAQETMLKIEVNARQVSLDPFNNLYLLTDEKEFRKYDRLGKLEESHSDLELSELSEISSDHPFKAMIYYPEYDLIRVFGNKLQILAQLNLTLFGFGEITCVAPSAGYQSFWLFDATGQKLIRVNQQYDVVDEGSDLIPILGEPIFPTIIKEREGWVYILDPDQGLFIFDNFGAFSKKLDLPGSNTFSVFKDRIFFLADGRIYEMDEFSNSSKALKVELEGKILGMTFRQLIIENKGVVEVIRF